MANTVSGLFGMQSPQQLQQDYLSGLMVSPAQMGQQGLLQQLTSVGANAGAMMGYGGGRLLGGKVSGEVEAGLVNKALEQVNEMGIKDPAQKMAKIGEILSANPATAKQGMIALQEAEKLKPKDTSMSLLRDFTTASVAKFRESKDVKDLVRYTQADKAKISAQGQRLVDEGLQPGSPEFISAMNQFRVADLEGTRKGSGVTITNELPGQKKVVDIPKFRSDLQATVKPYSQVVDAADTVITAINLGIDEGNFVAAKGASTALLKAFGDGQISRQEALSAGADPSIIGGGIDYVNQLFTGTPSEDTMKKIKKTAEALKKIMKGKRDKELEVQRSIAKSIGYKDEDIKNIFSGFDEKTSRTIVNTGVDKKTGRRVNKFSDGSVEYAN